MTRHSTLRHRLWMAASGLGLLVLVLVSMAVIGLVLAALLVAAMGDPVGDEVTYVNNTSRVLRLYDGENRYLTDLAPHASETLSDSERFWTGRVTAKTGDRRVAFKIDLTWAELKAQGYRIEFGKQDQPP